MKIIKKIRDELKITQKELADELKCNQPTISFIETGTQIMDVKMAKDLIVLAKKHGLFLSLDYIYQDI